MSALFSEKCNWGAVTVMDVNLPTSGLSGALVLASEEPGGVQVPVGWGKRKTDRE